MPGVSARGAEGGKAGAGSQGEEGPPLGIQGGGRPLGAMCPAWQVPEPQGRVCPEPHLVVHRGRSASEAKREAGPVEESPLPLQRSGLGSVGEGMAGTRGIAEAGKCWECRVKENSEVLQLPHQCSILHQTLPPDDCQCLHTPSDGDLTPYHTGPSQGPALGIS